MTQRSRRDSFPQTLLTDTEQQFCTTSEIFVFRWRALAKPGFTKVTGKEKVVLLLINAAKQRLIKTNISLVFRWLQLENYKQDLCVTDSGLREAFSRVTL